jgi:O-antigen ligase
VATSQQADAHATRRGADLFYRYLAYTLLLLLPVYRSLNVPVGPVGVSVVDLIIALGGLCIVAELLLTRGIPAFDNRIALLGIGLFFFAIVVSGLQAKYRAPVTVFLASLILKMILLYIIFRVTSELDDMGALLTCYLLAAGAMGAVAFVQQFDAFRTSDPRSVAGTLDARNELTFYLAPAAVLAVSLVTAGRRRAMALGLFVVIVVALVLSRGRAGTFLAFAGVVTYGALVSVRATKRYVATAMLMAFVFTALLGWWITSDSAEWLRHRYLDSFLLEIEEERGSTYARFLILQGLWEAWQESIWFGIGPNNFKERSANYVYLSYGDEVQPHNSYMGTLAELGLVGLFGLLLMLLPALKAPFSNHYKHPREIVLGVSIAYLVVLAHLMTFDAVARYPLWIFAGMCYALVAKRSTRFVGFA